MGHRFNVTFELQDGDWEVVEVKGGSDKKAKEFPLLPEDIAKLYEFKSVEIHMMRILDPGEETNRWCVVNRRKWWC